MKHRLLFILLLDTTIINSFYSMLADGSRLGTLKAICLRKELDWKRRLANVSPAGCAAY